MVRVRVRLGASGRVADDAMSMAHVTPCLK